MRIPAHRRRHSDKSSESLLWWRGPLQAGPGVVFRTYVGAGCAMRPGDFGCSSSARNGSRSVGDGAYWNDRSHTRTYAFPTHADGYAIEAIAYEDQWNLASDDNLNRWRDVLEWVLVGVVLLGGLGSLAY